MDELSEKIEITGQDGVVYDITPYQDPNQMKDYLGFIDQEGAFYRVRKITDPDYERPHDSWAKNFIDYYHLEKAKDLTNSMTLIKKYGFILSSYQEDYWKGERRTYIIAGHVGICDEETCERVVTNEKQLQTIKNIETIEKEAERSRAR